MDQKYPSQWVPLDRPRIYRPTAGFMFAYLLYGTIFLPAGLFGIWFVFEFGQGRDIGERLLFMGASLLLAGVALRVIVYALTRRLILHPDRVEFAWLLGRKSIPYAAIAGCTTVVKRGLIPFITLLSRVNDVKSIEFCEDFTKDEVFARWISSIPDVSGGTLESASALVRAYSDMNIAPTPYVPASERAAAQGGEFPPQRLNDTRRARDL